MARLRRIRRRVTVEIWSCRIFKEQARNGQDAERHTRFHPEAEAPRKAYITQQLEGRQGPAIVATDYIRAHPEQVRAYVPMHHTVLGTDGYGRSYTRANLRRHFEVDRFHVVAQAAISALAAEVKMTANNVSRAIKLYKIDTEKPYPLYDWVNRQIERAREARSPPFSLCGGSII